MVWRRSCWEEEQLRPVRVPTRMRPYALAMHNANEANDTGQPH